MSDTEKQDEHAGQPQPESDEQDCRLNDGQGITDRVKESASQIWLAGLGAYAKAEKEGSKLFDVLVKDGEKLEDKTRSYLDRRFNAAREKVEEVKAKASGSWNKVERAFDERVSSALHRLNIPTQTDIDTLVARIDSLAERIDALDQESRVTTGHSKASRKASRPASGD